MRFAVMTVALAACAAPSGLDVTINNNYAESIFTLTLTPTHSDGGAFPVPVFTQERIGDYSSGSHTLSSPPLGYVALDLSTTSAGSPQSFPTWILNITGSGSLTITYDLDPATLMFRAGVGCSGSIDCSQGLKVPASDGGM